MLNQIKTSLEKEYYKVILNFEELNGARYEQLIVSIIFQDHPQIPDLKLYIMFLPGVEKELDGVSVLQYYIAYTTSVKNDDHVASLKSRANELNKTLAIGHFGFNEFVICCGYKGEIIKNYFKNSTEPWSIELVDTGLETMTGGRIKKVEKFLDNQSFFLTYGDDLKAVDISKLLKFHNEQKKLVTLTAVQPPGRFGILGINGNNVTSLSEKPPGDGNWINGGYYVLEPDIFDKIHDDSDVWETNSLQNLIQNNQVSAFKYNDVYQPMDTMNDKEKLQK